MPKESKAKTKSGHSRAFKEIIIASLVVVFAASALFLATRSNERISFEAVSYVLDIADDPAEQQQGLSGREELRDGTGMLFIYDNPGLYGFWMKEMSFSIDMLWLSASGQVVHIERSVSPETFPEIFYPNVAASYVLEIPAGDSARYDIDVGDIATIEL